MSLPSEVYDQLDRIGQLAASMTAQQCADARAVIGRVVEEFADQAEAAESWDVIPALEMITACGTIVRILDEPNNETAGLN